MWLEINRKGCTRIVLLTTHYAVKIPNISDYRMMLYGLLANMQEARFSKTGFQELCPVLFSLPLGLLVVMPRVRMFTDEEFLRFDLDGFRVKQDYSIPVESKADSFGWLDGKPVALDYGT